MVLVVDYSAIVVTCARCVRIFPYYGHTSVSGLDKEEKTKMTMSGDAVTHITEIEEFAAANDGECIVADVPFFYDDMHATCVYRDYEEAKRDGCKRWTYFFSDEPCNLDSFSIEGWNTDHIREALDVSELIAWMNSDDKTVSQETTAAIIFTFLQAFLDKGPDEALNKDIGWYGWYSTTWYPDYVKIIEHLISRLQAITEKKIQLNAAMLIQSLTQNVFLLMKFVMV